MVMGENKTRKNLLQAAHRGRRVALRFPGDGHVVQWLYPAQARALADALHDMADLAQLEQDAHIEAYRARKAAEQ